MGEEHQVQQERLLPNAEIIDKKLIAKIFIALVASAKQLNEKFNNFNEKFHSSIFYK